MLSTRNTTDFPSSFSRTNDLPRTLRAGVRNQMPSTTSGSSQPNLLNCSHFTVINLHASTTISRSWQPLQITAADDRHHSFARSRAVSSGGQSRERCRATRLCGDSRALVKIALGFDDVSIVDENHLRDMFR